MSKGPGHVERSLAAVFRAAPDRIFTTTDLCWIAYGCTRPENWRRVSVLRSVKGPLRRQRWTSAKLGRETVFYNPRSIAARINLELAHGVGKANYAREILMAELFRAKDAGDEVRTAELEADLEALHEAGIKALSARGSAAPTWSGSRDARIGEAPLRASRAPQVAGSSGG